MEKNGNQWGLTAREVEVIDSLLAHGHAKGVAVQLGISPRTVEEHLAHARQKMGVETTLHALTRYQEWSRAEPAHELAALPKPARSPLRALGLTGVMAVALGLGFYFLRASATGSQIPDYNPAKGAPVLIGGYRRDPNENCRIVAIVPGSWKMFAMTPAGGDAYYPTWSPDGKKIAFTMKMDGRESIYSMNADSTGLRRLTAPTSDCDMPAFSSDNSRIAFRSRVDGQGDLYEMSAGGGPWKLLVHSGGDDRWPAYSPDGSELAFTSNRDSGYDIYSLSLGAGSLRRLTVGKGDAYQVTWRRDGELLAFITNLPGNWQIYTIHPDGSDLRRMTQAKEFSDGNPSFVGDDLVICRHDEDLVGTSLCVVSAAGDTSKLRHFGADASNFILRPGLNVSSLQIK